MLASYQNDEGTLKIRDDAVEKDKPARRLSGQTTCHSAEPPSTPGLPEFRRVPGPLRPELVLTDLDRSRSKRPCMYAASHRTKLGASVPETVRLHRSRSTKSPVTARTP